MTAFSKVVTHSVTSLTCFMPSLAVLPQSLVGQTSCAYLISLNYKAGVRLLLEKQSSFSHLHAVNMLKCICKA